MKYNFTFIEPVNRGALPLESSVTITSRGVQVGKSLKEALNLYSFGYIKIGTDEQAKAACIMPTDQKDAFKNSGEFGGKNVASLLLTFLPRKPFVSIEDGVAILTADKPSVEPVEPTEKPADPIPAQAAVITSPVVQPEKEEPKRRGRPPKKEPKDACGNCDYHKPVPGQDGRVKCEKHKLIKNIDEYCFHYSPELK